MTQFARPSSDVLNQGYTTDTGATTNLFDALNESTPIDTDFIQSALIPTADVYVTELNMVEDPLTDINHVVQYRIAKSSAGGGQINADIELRQDYVDETTMGQLVAGWAHVDIGPTFVTHTQTLTSPQATSITDYGSLFLRFVFTQV